MFDWINNEMLAGFANWLIVLVPAIGAFFVGLARFSGKALKYVKFAANVVELIDKASLALTPESDGGEKLTSKEIADLQKEFAEVKKSWEAIKPKK